MKPDDMMLHAISMIARSRTLGFDVKTQEEALVLLTDGVKLMNKAVDAEPDNIENHKYRLRHLLGITMNSPKNYIIFVQKDIKFFQENYNVLNDEDKAYFLSALGEYEIYIGNREEGIQYLKNVINNYPDSTIYQYTKTYLKKIMGE